MPVQFQLLMLSPAQIPKNTTDSVLYKISCFQGNDVEDPDLTHDSLTTHTWCV